MTAKEKARELFDKYQFVYIPNYTSAFEVKQCALIAVNEIIEIINPILKAFESESDGYWEQVKDEINKL